MSALTARRVIVVGAGAFGSSIALLLAQTGARVRLIEAASPIDNASSVAAGMLAPAFETLLDPLSAGHFALLREARDAWAAFIDRLGGAQVGFHRSGALWFGGDVAALERIGARAEPVSSDRLHRLAPDAEPGADDAVFTPEDWRLDARATLNAILAAGRSAGVERLSARVDSLGRGFVVLGDGSRLEADAVVLATGAGGVSLAPELTRLSPVKGHILRYPGVAFGPATPILRGEGFYGVVGADGVRVGATMQPGQADREIEPRIVDQLRAVACELFPSLANHAPIAETGVRATTPDGLPLVGPSSLPGVYLAVGARRNGWLLAPMVAAMIAAQVAGDDAGPAAALFDAGRFDR